ncbi:hypothetical protein CPB85DRAFT_119495 [Mucidula mucida]|nr:hypothetical protein CPB85DRAFT_119495 [Mucidula mucida]
MKHSMSPRNSRLIPTVLVVTVSTHLLFSNSLGGMRTTSDRLAVVSRIHPGSAAWVQIATRSPSHNSNTHKGGGAPGTASSEQAVRKEIRFHFLPVPKIPCPPARQRLRYFDYGCVCTR